MKTLCAGIALCAALSFAGSASATTLTYDVNMNFDPGHQLGSTGVGTITGTFSVDASNLKLTSIDLTEKTNTSDTFGGAFGSPTFTSLTFGNSSISGVSTGQNNAAFGGQPFMFISIQSNCCFLDGINIGPGFQFDFAYPQGGSVQPGNFDSITSENRYLYGSVTPEISSAVPEPSTWAMMIFGFAGVGTIAYRRKSKPTLMAV